MGRKPVADRGPNEVGAVGIEAFLDQQIDVAEVDVTQVDRDLFRLARSVAEPMNLGRHCILHHLSGWYMDVLSDISRAVMGPLNLRHRELVMSHGGKQRDVLYSPKADIRQRE